MSGGSSGGMSGGSSGGMSGGSSGGMAGGGGGAGGGVRGLGGQMPGGTGGSAGGGGNCGGSELPGGVGGMGEGGDCGGAVGQYPGETAAQKKARLEGTLDKSVDDFDGVIAEEQKEISTVGRDTDGFGGGAGGGRGTRVGLGKQSSGGIQGTGQDSATASSNAGGGATASVDSMSEDEIASRTPDDIPDLVSEDIVAKQLREAALAEDDPVLRARLWEEYRKYNKL
jgi:hypothetical protein